MPHTVFIRQFAEPIECEDDEPVLDAALRHGLDYPFGCHSGNCGSCKSVLISGEVVLRDHSEFALTPEEEEQGFILACQALPQTNVEVAFIDPDEPAEHDRKTLAGRVETLALLTHDIQHVVVRLDGSERLDFTPGQYAEVTFEGQKARDYSMASAPGEDRIEFYVRRTEGGDVSNFVLDELGVGDAVTIKGPFGVSYIRTSHRGPVIALGGGSGMAPIKSILDEAFRIGLRQPIKLYMGVRAEEDLYLLEHFEELACTHENFTFIPVLSEADDGARRRTGFLSEVLREDVAAAGGDLDGAKAYLAGPPVMVESCVEVLTSFGMEREHCHADAFYDQTELADRR